MTAVDVDDQLLRDLLAPVNTVGGVLSIALLGLRIVHKRLFH